MQLNKIINGIKARQEELALAAVTRPSLDNNSANVLNAGKWQGLQEALEIIDAALNEDDER